MDHGFVVFILWIDTCSGLNAVVRRVINGCSDVTRSLERLQQTTGGLET